ncbi:MAG: hypothetical protein HS115_07100 [Spirochaetales bacterium]|nr:hypothetical protein [Spirochaetales bacterium]
MELGLPAPITLLGRDPNGEPGVISVSFVIPAPEDSADFPGARKGSRKRRSYLDFNADRPVLGGECMRLSPELSGYDCDKKRKQSAYNLVNIFHALEVFGVPWPHSDVLLRYFIFDAFVGNTDRHHDNWMIIQTSKGTVSKQRIAPTFDHGPCLGGMRPPGWPTRDYLEDSEKLRRFYQSGRSAIYGQQGYLRFPDLVRACFAWEVAAHGNPDVCKDMVRRIVGLGATRIERMVSRIPADFVSDQDRQFFVQYLQVTANEIQKITDSVSGLES